MKKIMTLMLGLSLILGTAAFAADDKADAKPAGEKKAKKKSKKNQDAKHGETAAPATK